jgi:predicted nucleic acid-binding Zn finger protein
MLKPVGTTTVNNEAEAEKINELINEKKVKKIVFAPSKVEIWEVKSHKNSNIYWVDTETKYCSCKGFYYSFIKKTCYHISAVSAALSQNAYKIELLPDSEMNDYFNVQIDNLINNNI